jgi:hypothetical protein
MSSYQDDDSDAMELVENAFMRTPCEGIELIQTDNRSFRKPTRYRSTNNGTRR